MDWRGGFRGEERWGEKTLTLAALVSRQLSFYVLSIVLYIKANTFSYLNTFSDKTETLTSMAATSATQCKANESSTISAGINMRAPIGGLSVDFMSVIAILAVAQDASFFGKSFGEVVCKMTAGYYCSIGDNGSSGSND